VLGPLARRADSISDKDANAGTNFSAKRPARTAVGQDRRRNESARHQSGSGEGTRRTFSEGLRSLLRIAPCRHRGGVAQVAGHLF